MSDRKTLMSAQSVAIKKEKGKIKLQNERGKTKYDKNSLILFCIDKFRNVENMLFGKT